MKNARFLVLLAGVTAVLLALLLWQRPRSLPAAAPAPAPVAATPPATAATVLPPVVTPASPPPPAVAPARVVAAQNPVPTPPPPLPAGITAIQDQKTIDFSGGRAQVRNESADKAALEAGLREIEEATKGVTFGPNSGPPTLPGP